jgi:hypothetical protein
VFRPPRYDYRMKRPRVSVEQVRSMPRYADAIPVASVSCDAVSASDFRERYVKARKPVIVRGGIRHWKALADWDVDYLRSVAGAEPVQVTRCLMLDYLLRIWTAGLGRKARAQEARTWLGTLTLSDYLERCTARFDTAEILYARNVPLPKPIAGDVGPVAVQTAGAAGDHHTCFVGRRSYTDSHEHQGADSFMCQVRGTKEVILHPPDAFHCRGLYASRWTYNWSPVRFFDVDLGRFPRFARTRPYTAVVHQGDALYIPDPWWHAVVSADDELEITVTKWFDPPFLTLSCPQTVRRLLDRPRLSARAAARRLIGAARTRLGRSEPRSRGPGSIG